MAREKMGFKEIMAFGAYCTENKLDPKDSKSLVAWKNSLKSKDSSGTGKRGRQKGAKTRAFIYGAEGKLLGTADCSANDSGRMSVGVAAIQTYGAGNVKVLVFTRSFVGDAPKMVDSIDAVTGVPLRGYSVERTINAETGEETRASDSEDSSEGEDSSVDSDESDESESE